MMNFFDFEKSKQKKFECRIFKDILKPNIKNIICIKVL